MLRASKEHAGEVYDLSAITAGSGETGVAEGGLLIEFGEAVLGDDDDRLAVARAALVDALGGAALADAAGIVGLFNAIDRVADATGAPLEDWKAAQTESMRDDLGINRFDEAKAGLDPPAAGAP